MAVFAVVVGGLALLAGMGLSLQLDTPTGPSIVVAASALFLLVQLVPQRSP
jgi:zinc transport system permease protein